MPIRPLAFAAVFTAVFASPGLAIAVTWDKVGDTPLASVYVDRDSMRRSGNDVRATLEWRWDQETEVPDTNGTRMYRLERQVQVSNCTNRSYAVAEGTRYADARGTDVVSSYQYDERSLPYAEARPRTIRDTVIAHVCRAAPVPKKP